MTRRQSRGGPLYLHGSRPARPRLKTPDIRELMRIQGVSSDIEQACSRTDADLVRALGKVSVNSIETARRAP